MSATTNDCGGFRRPRAGILVKDAGRAAAEARARGHGAVSVVHVSTAEALRDLARGRQIDLAVVDSVSDLGATVVAVIQVMAAFDESGVKLAATADGVTPDNSAMTLMLASTLVDRQRKIRLDKAREGRARARARGVNVGRRQQAVDVARARDLLAEQRGINEVARIIGVSPRSLRRHLAGGMTAA